MQTPTLPESHVSPKIGQDIFITKTRKTGKKEGSSQTTGFAGLRKATEPARLVGGWLSRQSFYFQTLPTHVTSCSQGHYFPLKSPEFLKRWVGPSLLNKCSFKFEKTLSTKEPFTPKV